MYRKKYYLEKYFLKKTQQHKFCTRVLMFNDDYNLVFFFFFFFFFSFLRLKRFVALGTGLLWFGWFGFNGGSALASTGSAAFAAVNSEISASTALTVWTGIDWYKNGKPSLVGLCVGAVAGLATITPAAGFVRPWGAFVIGILSAFFCYGCCEIRQRMQWDVRNIIT